MVSIETLIVGVILVVIGALFFYFRGYFSERIVHIVMMIIGIIFLIVGIYYIAMGLIPGDSLVINDN